MTALLQEARASALCPAPRVARRIRQTAGLTQQRLADELGVHVATLARWEAGTNQPRGATRSRYSTLLRQLEQAISSGAA